MTAIKKIVDSNGVQYYPQTHTKAVVDDNGYTAESRLQAMQDEINQAQLEVGAVSSDLAPTENSVNWVTSGGVYNATFVGNSNVELDLTDYTEVSGFINNSNKWNTSYYGVFIPITPGDKFTITANSTSNCAYAFLTSNIVGSNGSSVSTFAEDSTRGYILSGESYTDTSPANGFFLWVGTTVSSQDDCIPQRIVVVNKVSLTNKILDIYETDEYAYPGSESIATSDLVYKSTHSFTEIELDSSWVAHGTGSTFTPSGEDGTNGVIHYDSDPTGTSDRCSLDISSLENGEKYLISFNLNTSTNQYPGSIGALAAYDSSWSAMLDIYGNNMAYYKRDICFVFEKTSSISVIAFSPSSFTIFPLDITISNFSLKLVKENEVSGNSSTLELYDEIDLSDYFSTGTINYYINIGDNEWKSSTASTSFFVPITPGKKYKIIGNSSKVSRYAILSSTSHSAGSTPSYVGMSNATNIALGGTVVFTCPEGAAWLNLCKKLDNTDDTPFYVGQISDNGSETLQQMVDSYNGNYPHLYYGEKISFWNTFNYRIYSTNSASGQSAAIYGDYLFIVKEKLTNVYCYNMRTKTLLYSLATGLEKDSTWHCTNTQFGIDRYSNDDMFPLLYTTVRNNNDGRCSFVGFRVIPTLSDGEIASFTITEIQTIYLPVMTDENCLGNTNIVIDYENGSLWGYGRNNNSSAANYLKARFTRFPMPALFNSNDELVSDVTYNDADIIDAFSADWSLLNVQGGFIKNGKLVIAQGYQSVGYINLRVVDLYFKKEMVSHVDLLANGFTQEPEGVFYWNDNIYTNTLNSNIWEIIT